MQIFVGDYSSRRKILPVAIAASSYIWRTHAPLSLHRVHHSEEGASSL